MQEKKSPRLFYFKPFPGSDGSSPNESVSWGHREVCIRPGLWMSLINFTPSSQVCLEYEKQFPVIDFGFVISGNIQKQSQGPDSYPDELQVRSGISGVRLENRQSGSFVVPAQQEHQILHLHMTLPFFRKVLKDESQVLPKGLRAVLKGDMHVEFTSTRPMTPDIQSVVYQVLNTSSNAYPWSLYLEGKSLELLSLHLAALSIDLRKSKGGMLNRSEKERIKTARSILIKDLQFPPVLHDLAAMAGLSVAKLQAGFKQAYGMSVFDYFREYRMQKARQLLTETETNVSETAWQVGYVNVSHFSAAFKKRFGILPKHYLKMHLV
ncbi:helix-turn-helix transcriptional regulator [Desulfobacula toluolica]|uniref:Preditced transcriptional regulator, AraC family n=1 Tax=Desulfobacula toluolica (strain DSM 7467 / Tol2) TaxID=651182 RepID=K0NF13_DESTT|nr:AraC family transcriptional regulator [Desulfobacula toluolica]CCK78223.1 preditced transcriptional regulator, AraC family [Desulfobacula toluolica Tol2]